MTTPVTIYTFGPGAAVLGEEVVDLEGDEEARYLAAERLRTAYSALRSWAVDAENVSTNWPTMPAQQRDTAMVTTFHRLSVLLDRMADLLADLDRA